MIFQAWVMSRCGGKPSDAVRRIEAANGGKAVDRTRIYRALRKPAAFPVRFARTVVAASGGACQLEELTDLETIRLQFEYADPVLRQRGIEYQLTRAERRRDTAVQQRDRLDARIAELDAELDGYRAQLAAVTAHATG